MKTLAVLIECTCYDPVTASTKTVRFCNRNDPRVTTYNGNEWRPLLIKSPAVGLSVFNGDFSGFGQNTIDQFVVAATDQDLDVIAAYTWYGATVKIYAGDMSASPVSFPLVFTATGSGANRKSNESITVNLDTFDRKLGDRQLLYLSYAGTGDAEGTVDLTGVLKPMVFGNALYCRPVLIDEVNQIYQVHGYGPVESIYGVFEGGLAIGTGGNPAGSYSGTYAAFKAQAVAQGEWIRHNNLGLIKLGSSPTFPITCHVKGDTNGVAGGSMLTKAADVVKRMVTMNVAGVTLSNSSIANLNAAAAYPIDLYFEDQVSVLDAIAIALRSIGAYWFWDATGVMCFGRMRFSAASLTLSAKGDQLPDVMSVSQLATSAPVWSLRFGANACHFVHDASDVPNMLVDLQNQINLTGFVFPPSATPPSGSPVDGDTWPDTSTSPVTYRRYDGGTATWIAIAANGAQVNAGNVFDSGSGTPTTPLTRAQLVTLLGTAAAITGQGQLATLNQLVAHHLPGYLEAGNLANDANFTDQSYWAPAGSHPATVSFVTSTDAVVAALGAQTAVKFASAGSSALDSTRVQGPATLPTKAGRSYVATALVRVTAGFNGALQLGLFAYDLTPTFAQGVNNIPAAGDFRTTPAGADMTIELVTGALNLTSAAAVLMSLYAGVVWGSSAPAGNAYLTNFEFQKAPRLGRHVTKEDQVTILTDALAVTSLGTAAGIAGQGALATLNSAAWATQVSGRPTELTDGRVAAGLTSAGDLARDILSTRANTSNLLRYTAGGLFTGELAADVTSTHTAAAIVSQGALATLSSADWATQVGGASKPADYASASATFAAVNGTFTFQGNQATKTSAAGWTSSAYILQPMVGSGSVQWRGDVADGLVWMVGLTDSPTAAIASSTDVEANADFVIYKYAAGSVRSYAAGVGYGTQYPSVATDATMFTIIYDGVFVQCYYGTTLMQTYNTTPGKTLYFVFYPNGNTCYVKEARIGHAGRLADMNSNIYDLGSGTPYATVPRNEIRTPLGTAAAIAGQGSLATQNQAAWGTDVSGRPTELTDGRVAAGLTSSGDLNRNILSTRADSSNILRRTSGGLFTGELAADVTATHTAASITGQGALATRSTVSSTQLPALEGGNLILDATFSLFNDATAPSWVTISNGGTVPIVVGSSDAASIAMVSTNSLKFQSAGSTASGSPRANYNGSSLLTVVVGESYRIRCKTYVETGFNGQFNIGAFCYGPSGAFVSSISVTGTDYRSAPAGANTTATIVSVPKVIPAGTAFIQPYIQVSWTSGVPAANGYASLPEIRKLPKLNDTLTREDGTTLVTDATAITSLGTASAIAGQGALATKSTANLDSDVVDGSTYARIKASELTSGQHKVTIAGSGVPIGDQRNLPPIAAANLHYTFTGAITYTTTATSISISVGAGTLYLGSSTISYNSMSASVTGLVSGSTHTWYLYVSANAYVAGAHTLNTTETNTVVYNNDANVYIGSIGPVTLSSGGSGGGSGGGGTCVWLDAWVHTARGWVQAREVGLGDQVLALTLDRTGFEWVDVEAVHHGLELCYTLKGRRSGVEVTVSESTPITLRNGQLAQVSQLAGHELPFERDGQLWWEPVEIREAGRLEVAKIRCHQRTYSAGDAAGVGIATHNPKP